MAVIEVPHSVLQSVLWPTSVWYNCMSLSLLSSWNLWDDTDFKIPHWNCYLQDSCWTMIPSCMHWYVLHSLHVSEAPLNISCRQIQTACSFDHSLEPRISRCNIFWCQCLRTCYFQLLHHCMWSSSYSTAFPTANILLTKDQRTLTQLSSYTLSLDCLSLLWLWPISFVFSFFFLALTLCRNYPDMVYKLIFSYSAFLSWLCCC